MEVHFSPAHAPYLSALVASVTRVQSIKFTPKLKGDVSPHLKNTKDAEFSLNGDVAIARYIAKFMSPTFNLQGASALEEVEVDQWIQFASTLVAIDKLEVQSKLNEILQSRTFLVGYQLTLADIALMMSLRNVPIQDKNCHVMRWLRTITESASMVQACNILGVKSVKPAGDAGKKAKGKDKPIDAEKAARIAKAAKKPPKAGMLPGLMGAEEGKVVTRFPPEPSGYLHVGHVKAVMLNNFYARHYKGKLILRFDDTNPLKEKVEFEESIIEDLARLNIVPDRVSHTSDFFPEMIECARRLLSEGKAYMDDTPQDQMRQERMDGIESKRRNEPPKVNLERFELMLNGPEEGRAWCMRAKMSMTSKNKAMRDPVMFRRNEASHTRVGSRWKAYPTYDFACPIVDSIEGVTHTMRTTEFKDRDDQYKWLQNAMNLRPCEVHEFARMNFEYTVLSKRKLAKLVDAGYVEGWNDARFPTVQGCLRRGMQLESLREFILSQGASKRIVEMEWDKFWALNKKVIDPRAGRYTAISTSYKVPARLTGPGAPSAIEFRSAPLHPKNAELGTKPVQFGSSLLLEGADVELCKEGEEITLMKWGNAIVRSITRDANDKPISVDMELYLEGDFKKTEKKLTWLADTPDTVLAQLVEYDVLVTKAKLEDGDDIEQVLNPHSKIETEALGEAGLRCLNENDVIQLERRGYYRVDRPYMGPGKPIVLFQIPEGKKKNMSHLTSKHQRVDVAQYQAKVEAQKAKRTTAKQSGKQ